MEEFIPIVAILMVFGIPMVAILTHHQRKMAELLHSRSTDMSPAVMNEIEQLRAEVADLKTRLNEATIALDDVRRSRPAIEDRVREG